jgi:hypothetical protein
MFLRIKLCYHQLPGRTKLLKSLYPTVHTCTYIGCNSLVDSLIMYAISMYCTISFVPTLLAMLYRNYFFITHKGRIKGIFIKDECKHFYY